MVSVWSAVAISWGIIPWVSFWLFTFSVKHLFISFAHFSGGFLFWFGFFVFVCLKAVIEQFASHSMVFCLHNPGLKWEDYFGMGWESRNLTWSEASVREKLVRRFLFLLLKPLFTFVRNTPASGILFSQLGPVPVFLFLSWVCDSHEDSLGVSVFLTDTAWETATHSPLPYHISLPPQLNPCPSGPGIAGSCTLYRLLLMSSMI